MRGQVPATSSNPQFLVSSIHPLFSYILRTLSGNGFSSTPLESIRCAFFPSRRGCTAFSAKWLLPGSALAFREEHSDQGFLFHESPAGPERLGVTCRPSLLFLPAAYGP